MKMGRLKIKRILSLLVITLSLQGCLAAVPLIVAANMAASGFFLFKSVQTVTGGNVNISFSETDISNEDKVALSQIMNPAIWPDNEMEVYMASMIEVSGEFSSVTTPSTVTRILVDEGVNQTINLMTTTEQLQIFRRVCEVSGADGVVAFKNLGSESRGNFLSLNRANTTQHAELLIYSYELNRIIFTTELELVTERGSDIQNNQEILQIAGEAAAEKIIQLRQS